MKRNFGKMHKNGYNNTGTMVTNVEKEHYAKNNSSTMPRNQNISCSDEEANEILEQTLNEIFSQADFTHMLLIEHTENPFVFELRIYDLVDISEENVPNILIKLKQTANLAKDYYEKTLEKYVDDEMDFWATYSACYDEEEAHWQEMFERAKSFNNKFAKAKQYFLFADILFTGCRLFANHLNITVKVRADSNSTQFFF